MERGRSVASSLADLQKEPRYWQRLLRFAGYYTGKTDGILGPLSKAAAAQWEEESSACREELGMFDERSESCLTTLIPKAQRAARLWLRLAMPQAQSEGREVKVICGTRTYVEQDALARQRPRVTRAVGGQSFHNFGIAWDFGVFRGKAYEGEHALYRVLGGLHAQVAGMEWGGNWTSFVDEPHLQLALYSGASAARRAFEV